MNTILKNVVRFTGLVVGVPVVQPHNLNLSTNGILVPLLPQFVATNAGGFTVTVTDLTVTVTRTAAASTGNVLVYVEHWHTIEEVLPPGNLATLVPFVIQPGTGGGGGGVDTDGVTIGGDGTAGNALFVIPSGLDEQVAVAVDGVTITGDGTTANPLVAAAAPAITELTADVLAGPGSGAQAATVVALQGNPIVAATPTDGQVLTWDGTQWVPGSVPTGGSGGGGIVLYLNEGVAPDAPTTNIPLSTNGLVSVKELGKVAEVPGASVTSSVLSQVSYDLVAGFVTDLGVPGVTEIPAGLWDVNLWASSSASQPNHTLFQIKLYTYDGVNAPTLFATSSPSSVYDPASTIQYATSVLVPQTVILATDRIYVEVLARATTGSTQVTFYFGDNTPTHIHTTLPSVAGTGIVHVVNGAFVSPASPVILSSATEVTGVLPIANGGTATSVVPTNGQLLIGNGTGYAVANLTPGSGISITDGAGMITIASTVAGGITELTGDVTAGPGSGSQNATVTALQGNSVSNVLPNNGDVLTYNASAVGWEPAPPAAAVTVVAINYTATGSEGASFVVNLPTPIPTGTYEVWWAPKGVANIPLLDLPTAFGDRTTSSFRVVIGGVPLVAGDKLVFFVLG